MNAIIHLDEQVLTDLERAESDAHEAAAAEAIYLIAQAEQSALDATQRLMLAQFDNAAIDAQDALNAKIGRL